MSWEWVGIAAASPVLGWLASLAIAKTEARRVHKRLVDEPLVFPGATFDRLYTDGGAPIMEAGRIASLERGRIVLESMDGKRRITMTLAEFEKCHPVWTATDEEIGMSEGSGSQF